MHDWSNDLKLNKNEITVFIISLTVILAAKGAALFPLAYSMDCYSGMLTPSHNAQITDLMIAQGRFVQAFMSKVMNYLGVNSPLTNTFYVVIYMFCTVWVGILVCRMWKIIDSITLSTLVVLFITIHPYQAELFTFKATPLYTSVALALAFLAIYFSDSSLKATVITSSMLMLSLGIYQIGLNYVFITLCMAAVMDILRQVRLNKSFSLKELMDNVKVAPRLGTMFFGLILYIIINKSVLHFLHITPQSRASFIPLEEIGTRLYTVVCTLYDLLVKPEAVLPASVKYILILILISSITLIAKQIILNKNKLQILPSLLVFTLIALSALGVLGVIIPLKELSIIPRILSGISFFWAGIVAVAFLTADNKMTIYLVSSLCCIILFCFTGINNHIFTDQLRVNMRDRHKANRIVAKMEQLPEFSKVKRVEIVGGVWGYASPIYTVQGDMNASAFLADWSKLNVIKEVSGYNFGIASQEEKRLAENYCNNAPKWPSENSIVIEGEFCVVCQ